MRAALRCAVVLVWTALLPSLAFAQASITGTVKDTSGAVLPGVTVEAASPVLIEKAREAVTDTSGRFQVVDLRPGTYTITFSLPGFNTVKRDGVALSGSAAVTVDAELRVGALEETITVTGEAPVVDVTSTTQQRVISSEAIDALPSARNYFGLARMIPGTLGGGNDVGGSLIQDVGQSVTVHGSRNVDQRVTVNGVSTMTLQAGGNIGGQTPDVGSASEVTVDTSSLSADLSTGGVRINFVPKDGGNRFANSLFFTFSNDSLQGNNYTDELRLAGLAAPTSIVKNLDVNESLGGPFKRDKVWFWFSTRYNETENEVSIYRNKNEYDPTKWLYEENTAQPGVNKGYQVNNSIRVTWQATPRNKIAGTYKFDKWCNCPNNISATVAPEAGRDRRFPRLAQEHLEWTSPVTNKLLFEAVGLHLFERWGNMHYRVDGGSLEDPSLEAVLPQLIGVLEQSRNLNYRILTNYNNTAVPSFTYRAAGTYVTGSHAFKVGFNNTQGHLDEYMYTLNNLSYRFNNGVPNQITERAFPFRVYTNLDNDLGLYAQDRWTLNRWTVQGAVRFDYFGTSFPEQTVGPSDLTPTRNLTFPAQDNISWKDLTYRSGLAYDVFGNGKTAVKVAFNKYLLGQTLNGLGRDPNPVVTLRTLANRPWNDRGGLGINNDYTPQCNLQNPAANGECGPIDDTNFGTAVAGELFDPDLISGFNHRQTNWEFSTSVQREIVQSVAVDVGYFRRAWAHFRVTDNLLLTPEDFTRFDMVAPVDPRLPNGGGYTLSGFYNVVPDEGRPGAQPERPLRRLRLAVRELERRRLDRERAAAEWHHRAGRHQHRQDHGGQLRDRGQAAGDEQPGRGRQRHAGVLARRPVLPPRVAVPDAGEGIRRLHHSQGGGAGVRLVPLHSWTDAGDPSDQRRQRRLRGDQRVPGRQLHPRAAIVRRRGERDLATGRAPDDVDRPSERARPPLRQDSAHGEIARCRQRGSLQRHQLERDGQRQSGVRVVSSRRSRF